MARGQRARLGQVFLKDNRIEHRIADAVGPQVGDVVLEIGAGPGNMTARLAASGARVVAVELDPKWAAELRQRFSARPFPEEAHEQFRVEVVEADVLDVAIDEVVRAAGRERVKVFGNLPYYITSPILLHLFGYHTSIEEIVVMVQQEVARRIVAMPGEEDYGLLSLTCQYYTRPKLLFSIPPEAFRPQPKVISALVRMTVAPQREALGIEDEAAFWKWMRAAFAQKRKTLANNWKGFCEPERARATMERQGINPLVRAEALSLAQLAGLYRALFHQAV